MKRTIAIICALLVWQSSRALIVSVNGEGEVPDEGLDLVITEGGEDPLTGRYTMALEGDLLTPAAQITVRITRSAEGLTDEFCCGNNCTAGNRLTEETKVFAVSGVTKWHIHYEPETASDETIRYIFDDGEQSLELRVQYVWAADGVEQTTHVGRAADIRMHNGQVLIIRNGQTFTMTGAAVKMNQ